MISRSSNLLRHVYLHNDAPMSQPSVASDMRQLGDPPQISANDMADRIGVSLVPPQSIPRGSVVSSCIYIRPPPRHSYSLTRPTLVLGFFEPRHPILLATPLPCLHYKNKNICQSCSFSSKNI